jgi:hypothetical protein
MSDGQSSTFGSVERLPTASHSAVVSDELNRVLAMLRESCPKQSQISFDFDGRLHVHIDVRKREDVILVEAILPTMGLGLFHTISHGETPHHPFFHRISAIVDR